MSNTDIQKWFEDHPEVTNVQVAACDINGIWRGKRVPVEQIGKVLKGEMRMPISALALDIWGRDIEGSPLVFDTGDVDGRCEITDRGLLPFLVGSTPTVFLPVWMVTDKGDPSPVDPRRILAEAVERATALDYFPQMALEMEFYLVDPKGDRPRTPLSPVTGKRLKADSILSVDELDQFENFFSQTYEACRVQGVGVDTAISESGRGQFEINLFHTDPLRAADDAVLFKRIVKSTARRNLMAASFMAKPFTDRAGSGLHVHFSLLDKDGVNVFDDGGPKGSETLLNAVGGVIGTLKENALLWAPHLNSYRRLQPGSHAPTGICWAYENRTAAIRIPGGDYKARRIEHRVAGADANPYLVLAAILHGALDGIEMKMDPNAPINGDAYALELERLPTRWMDAIREFEESEFIDRHFSTVFQDVYKLAKTQENIELNARISDFELSSYLETV